MWGWAWGQVHRQPVDVVGSGAGRLPVDVGKAGGRRCLLTASLLLALPGGQELLVLDLAVVVGVHVHLRRLGVLAGLRHGLLELVQCDAARPVTVKLLEGGPQVGLPANQVSVNKALATNSLVTISRGLPARSPKLVLTGNKASLPTSKTQY